MTELVTSMSVGLDAKTAPATSTFDRRSVAPGLTVIPAFTIWLDSEHVWPEATTTVPVPDTDEPEQLAASAGGATSTPTPASMPTIMTIASSLRTETPPYRSFRTERTYLRASALALDGFLTPAS